MAPPLPFPSFPLLIFLLFTPNSATAQSPPNETTTNNNNNNNNINSPQLNPSLTIIIVLFLSLFLFIGFLSIYIRHCSTNNSDTFRTANISAAARIRIPQGLHPNVLEKFPTLVYSEVKHHKVGKGELECAICINEFEDDETIRILPVCDHVFHMDCIDAWLASHVTCPVCRANYISYSPDVASKVTAPAEVAVALPADAPPARDVEEIRELARIASKVRGKSSRNILRSHSAGNFDRYTLRLPENLRREIFAAGKMRRVSTFAAAVGGGEGGIRRGRSIHLGRADRRPSFFGRSLSLRIPTFRNGKDNSMSKKFTGVRVSEEGRRRGGAGGGGDGEGYSDTAALNRMV